MTRQRLTQQRMLGMWLAITCFCFVFWCAVGVIVVALMLR